MDIQNAISNHLSKRQAEKNKPPEKSNYHKVGIIFLAIGLGVTALGAGLFWNEYTLTKNGITTEGTITKIELTETTDEDRRVGYIPFFTFTDQKNNSHTVKSTVIDQFETKKVGDKVPVIYHKNNPEQAQINNDMRWYAPKVAISLGLIQIIIGAVLLRKFKNK